MNFLVVDGTKLSYREHGVGLPVVFLHPTPLDHVYWRPFLEQLSGVRAIMPDLRGHGASELGELPVGGFSLVPDAAVLSVTRLAKDTLALLDSLGVEEAVFAGCSIGGYVLLELWRCAPERVKGLAFVCSKPQPDAPVAQERRVATIAKARAGGREELFDGVAGSLTGNSTRKARPEIVNELRARMTISADALVAVQAGLGSRPDSMPTVGTIRVPVLAVCGGEDGASSQAEMEAFRGAAGGCEMHVLPDAGHFAAYEQPEKVAAIFSAWVERQRF